MAELDDYTVRLWLADAQRVIASTDPAPFMLGQAARIAALAEAWLDQRQAIIDLLQAEGGPPL